MRDLTLFCASVGDSAVDVLLLASTWIGLRAVVRLLPFGVTTCTELSGGRASRQLDPGCDIIR